MTDSLLFDWSELLTFSNNEKPEFRYVDSQNGIKPNSYTQYAMPKDIADISRERDINQLADVISVRISNEYEHKIINFVFRVKYKCRIRMRRVILNRTLNRFVFLLKFLFC
jgi:hypothetical protein